VGTDEAAEARRAERRRARAEARRAEARSETRILRDPVDDDDRVVMIRANRATPPTGEEGGDVVLPPNRPPLRPAQPAAQPKRRRFTRSSR
jgi:hypothetical protein